MSTVSQSRVSALAPHAVVPLFNVVRTALALHGYIITDELAALLASDVDLLAVLQRVSFAALAPVRSSHTPCERTEQKDEQWSQRKLYRVCLFREYEVARIRALCGPNRIVEYCTVFTPQEAIKEALARHHFCHVWLVVVSELVAVQRETFDEDRLRAEGF